MKTLINNIQEQTNTTNAYTANGAVTNKSTLSPLIDYFGLAGAMREQPGIAIDLFKAAYAEDPDAAMKILFYLRDIRGGQGERQHFRNVWDWLMLPHITIDNDELSSARHNATHIPEFGRWDDLLRLVIHPALSPAIEVLVREVLHADLYNSEFYDMETVFDLSEFGHITEKEEPAPNKVSLLAKWMPSLTANNKDVQQSAKDWCARLDLTQKQYRKMLKHLRSHLNVVEQKMCSKNWQDINYSQVPSQAMLRLRQAFTKNDPGRYGLYLQALEEGKEEVKAGTLYPYQLVEKCDSHISDAERKLIAAQWLALPEYSSKPQNILTVCDVSGSMKYGTPTPINVAMSLTLYLASRCTNKLWANKFITFSEDPELQTINPYDDLYDQVNKLSHANWGMDTNIEKTFDLLIHAANINRTTEMPDSIIIISDMEFNQCAQDDSGRPLTNFENIDRKFREAGLVRPNLVFWNVNARSGNTPITVNDQGVALVSGFSPSIMQMCFSGDLSPESCLREIVLNNPRYQHIKVEYV